MRERLHKTVYTLAFCALVAIKIVQKNERSAIYKVHSSDSFTQNNLHSPNANWRVGVSLKTCGFLSHTVRCLVNNYAFFCYFFGLSSLEGLPL